MPPAPVPKPAPPKVEITDDECGLGVAQIVITAATPMMEEPDQPFPPTEPEPEPEPERETENTNAPERIEENDDEESSLSEQTAVCLRDSEEGHADSAPHPQSSSTASEGESGASVASGPPTAPQSPPSAPRAGRASIPDELEPAQLARLTNLKESNA